MQIDTIHTKVTALIGCATSRFEVDGGKAKAVQVATCESSLWPWASSNQNEGLFQLRYWHERAMRYLRPAWFWQMRDHDPATVPSPYLARANTLVAIRLAHEGSWSPWACG